MKLSTTILFLLTLTLAWLVFRKYATADKGIGDSVHAVTSYLGIKQWEHCGCKVRQEKWNRALPY